MSGSRPWRQAVKPRISPDDVRFGDFTGVVNTRSRMDIGLKSLVVADNVFISDSKKVTRREGYSIARATGTVWSAYGDTGNLYVVDAGVLLRIASPTDARTLTTGLSNRPYCWDDNNDDAFFANGVDAGIARGDAYLPWRLTTPTISDATVLGGTTPATRLNVGQKYVTATFRVLATFETGDGRETAPSEIVTLTGSPSTNLIRVTLPTLPATYARTNVYCTEADGAVFQLVASTTSATTLTFNPARGGRTYLDVNTSSLPAGVTHLAFDKGRCFVGQYIPASKMSVVWISRPFAPHLYNLAKDFLPVTGEIALLLSNNAGVLIGTTKAIYQYDDKTGELNELVDYGVVPGTAGDTNAEGVAYFWTQRGICKAMPFENITESDVSMAPGTRAVASMVYLNGKQQFLTVTQGGGVAFNSRQERT